MILYFKGILRILGDNRLGSFFIGSSFKGSFFIIFCFSFQVVSFILGSQGIFFVKYFVVKLNNQKVLDIVLLNFVFVIILKSEIKFNKVIQVYCYCLFLMFIYWFCICCFIFLFLECKLILRYCFQDGKEVYFIFFTIDSVQFQGYVKVIVQSSQDKCFDMFGDGLGGIFKIEWMKK